MSIDQLEASVTEAAASLARAEALLSIRNADLHAHERVPVSEAWLATREHQDYWFRNIRFGADTDGQEMLRAFQEISADADALASARTFIDAARRCVEALATEARLRAEATDAAEQVQAAREALAMARAQRALSGGTPGLVVTEFTGVGAGDWQITF